MFNIELPDYYTATIDTIDGELDIVIPKSITNKYPLWNYKDMSILNDEEKTIIPKHLL